MGEVTVKGTPSEFSQLLSKEQFVDGAELEFSYFSISANKSKLSVSLVPSRSIGSMSKSPNLSTCPRSSTKSFRSPQNSKRGVLKIYIKTIRRDIDHFHNQRNERELGGWPWRARILSLCCSDIINIIIQHVVNNVHRKELL